MLRWAFFLTWVGIFVALVAVLWALIRLNTKLDRDRADREVQAHWLEHWVKKMMPPQDEPPSHDRGSSP